MNDMQDYTISQPMFGWSSFVVDVFAGILHKNGLLLMDLPCVGPPNQNH